MKSKKIAKGYRLKPETHEMIKNIQKMLNGDLDYAINTACKKFLNGITKNSDSNKIKTEKIK